MITNKPSQLFLSVATVLLSSLIFLDTNVIAQTERIGKNTVYAEGASKGATYSLNYERVFSYGDKFAKSYRVGLCFLNDVLAVPIGIQFISGKGVHHAEYSFTAVPYIEHYNKLFSGNSLADKKIFLMPGAGYRYQKPGNGFFGKVVVGPIIYLDPASDNFWRMDPKLYAGITVAAGFAF